MISGAEKKLAEILKDPLQYIPRFFRVLTKSDKTGKTSLVPMVLWKPQEYYIRHKSNRNIAVKNRQQGLSTGVEADNSHALFTNKFERQVLITNDQETSEFLFQTVQRFHRELPDVLRPRTDWKSGMRMRFPDLDSYIYIDSAKSDTLGIGHTLSRAHLSEVARWSPRRAEQLYSDISQTVPEGGYITLESTPKGRAGLFYKMAQAAKRGDIDYTYFFFPWWWDITCVRAPKGKLEYTKEEVDLIAYVQEKDEVQLSPEQIAFRRAKLAELGDLWYQEYPENDTDCWLAGEQGVFDAVAMRRYLRDTKEGRKEGNVTIWKDVIGGEKYVIGIDVAGGHERGDYSVASTLRVKTNEYVSRLRGRIHPDLFAEELFRLGVRYNDAMIGVPLDPYGQMVLKYLMDKNYPNIYYNETINQSTMNPDIYPGFKVSSSSKPSMVETLVVAIRSEDLISWSDNLMTEASSYVWANSKSTGKALATKMVGYFDDELDAMMLALIVREGEPIAQIKETSRIHDFAPTTLGI